MAASIQHDFDSWLSQKLQDISPDIDLDVFVSYIRGMLETDETNEEKHEAISDLLGEIVDTGLQANCDEILMKWEELEQQGKQQQEQAKQKEAQSIEERLSSIVQQSTVPTTKSREMSAEELARKAAILAQYAQCSDGEQSGDEGEEAAGGDTDNMVKNMNALSVDKRVQEQREKNKADHVERKQKDKEDREKQKSKVEDRKDAEKKRTQKGEKRR